MWLVRSSTILPRTLLVLGAIAGYFYARHVIALNIAYMREHWGWVCGTGLYNGLYFWPPVGAATGFFLGKFCRFLLARLLAARIVRGTEA